MEKINMDSQPLATPQPALEPKRRSFPYALILVVFVMAGLVSGYLFARAQGGGFAGGAPISQAPDSASSVKVGAKYGASDESTFRDKAEGVLEEGGVDGEGSHHLVRPGGPMQNVYLTSSIVDLDMFVGHKIKVWGETVGAKKAGWLMDVGIVEVTELNAPLP